MTSVLNSQVEELTELTKKYTPKSTGAVVYNLCEPVLVALSLGCSLQFANIITMVYVIIDICAITPMILSTRFEIIRTKLVLTWVKFGLAIVSIALKVTACFYYKPGGWIAKEGRFLGFYEKKDAEGQDEPDYVSNFVGDGTQILWCVLLAILYHFHRTS